MSVHCNKEFIILLACYMKGLINGELTKSLCYIPTDIFAKDMFQVRKALEFKIKKNCALVQIPQHSVIPYSVFLAPCSQDNKFLSRFLDKPFFTEVVFTFFGAWAADSSLPVSTSMSLSPSPKSNGVARAAFSLRISNENK